MNKLLQKFLVYAEFRMKRLWWFLRYGGIKNVPIEVLRKHFDNQFEKISKGLEGTNQELPELMKDVWRHGNEGHQERLMNLLRASATLDEDFERMRQSAELLLRAATNQEKKENTN